MTQTQGGAGGLSSATKPHQTNASPSNPLGAVSAPWTPNAGLPGAGVKPIAEAPTERLGAGGTSAAVDENEGADRSVAKGGSGLGKAAGVAAAVPAASAAGQVLIFAMFLNYLKGLMLMLMAVASNLWTLAMGVLLAAGKAAVGFVMGVGTAVSSAVGGAISAAAAGVYSVVGGVAAVALVAVGVTVSVSDNDTAMRDGLLTDCRVVATAALGEIDGSAGAVDEKTTANAQTIFSVLAAWGMPDENIAGIIGNWDAESGIDPTSVQNHFKSPHEMTEQKRTAATDTDNGIGLGQWTFGRNTKLREYADSHGEDWWTLTIQLGFMLSAAEGSDADIVKDMIANSKGTPAEAAAHFHDSWERSADNAAMAARRGEYATKWMGLFSGWEKNQTLADSILEQAGTTVDGANSVRAAEVRSNCVKADPEQVWIADGTGPGPWGGFENGKIPASALTQIPWATNGKMLLRSDATKALGKLNVEFKSVFGYDIPINDAYRDYAGQVQARAEWCAMGKCENAATPGTSNHGWALAIDIATKNHASILYTSPEYLWLKKNAGKYGWVHPAYMEPGGTGPFEPWHWEFHGTTSSGS